MSIAQSQTTLDKIRTRGYWRVVIRPTCFDVQHIPEYSRLFSIVEGNSVQIRGWRYPYVDYRSEPVRGADWVGQEADWDYFVEVWRLYQSGQFIHFFAIAGDWRDQSSNWPAEETWQPGRHLLYIDTIYELLEIFEFASRLALSPAGSSSMRLEIRLESLEGRQLIETDIRVPISGIYTAQIPTWIFVRDCSQIDLISSPRELAAQAARDLFAQFGFDVSLEMLGWHQARIGR